MRKTISLIATLFLLQGCIDMKNEYLDIAKFYNNELSSFFKSNPNEKIYTIFLGAQPISGRITISMDTKENSLAEVIKWEHKGPAWYGEDIYGKYNNSSADFKYPFINEMIIPEWETIFWSVESNILSRNSHATVTTIDAEKISLNWSDDHDYNEFYFNQLIKLFERILSDIDYSKYNMDSEFRVGIQIFDDNLIKTWYIENK